MIRVLILLVCFGLHGGAQTPLTVPFRLDVQGKPFQGRVSVRVLLKNRVVAKGSNSKSALVFKWQPEEGASYDLDLTAGRHRVRITEVHAYDFRSTWAISLAFPPFQSPCGMEVPEGDRSRVVRVDCVVFDDQKGDPPQRVMTHIRTPR